MRCPKCLMGTLKGPLSTFNSQVQPKLVCDTCGSPFWYCSSKEGMGNAKDRPREAS